jgi:hypothetical protein
MTYIRRYLNMCEEHSMAGKGPIIETIMEETLELLTEEQKRKVAVMRIEKIIKILEMKISYMEKMIAIKKEAIDNVRKVQEMIQHGKC